MSAARVTPIPATEWEIVIGNGFAPSTPGLIISPGDSVLFVNMTEYPVNIVFDPTSQPQPMFSDTPVIPAGGTYLTTTSPDLDGSEMFNVYSSGVKKNDEPYVIQVGRGPLYIAITHGITAPDPAVIPPGGTLRIVDSANHSYRVIDWKKGGNSCPNPFNPPLAAVGNHLATAEAGDYQYTLSSTSPIVGDGGGTIKVTS
jgi:hypothetical protein